jgi:hypothetical protein
MRKHLLSIAACVLATSATATTFPSFTTIYVITGIKDSGGADNTGAATAVQCSNVSGVTTTIRYLTLSASGTVLGTVTRNNVAHGETVENSTKGTFAYNNEGLDLIPDMASISAGVLNIESLQSGVFCTAAIIDASNVVPIGVSPHIIRVNPHPGSVE